MASSSAHLSRQMRAPWLLATLLSLFMPNCRSLAPEALQTEWQKHLFEEVEATATKLSEAAVPLLLARLDSPLFRAELSRCCPSFRNLSAPQLLQRLQEKVAVSEIISGFPSAGQKEGIWPDSPGMSVEDGLKGSFFQNVWQMVLLDAKDPDGVFHQLDMEYAKVSCDLERKTAIMEQWASSCSNQSGYKTSYPLDSCMKDPASGMIVQYKCTGGTFKMKYWSEKKTKLAGHRLRLLLSTSAANVTCPQAPADYSESYTADSTCHGYVRENASDGWNMQDHAELRQYGLKPFENAGAPKTLEEAAERGPYAMVNNFLLDAGSPMYGDVSAVFSNEVLRKITLLSAVDTGYYENVCLEGQRHFLPGETNDCSVIAPFKQLGTLEHFNHLFLLNEDFWNTSSTLLGHFRRLEGFWGSQPVASKELLHYWEAVPAGILRYPEAVRFLIASFPSLFGSPAGALVQEWARQRGWILLWSLGPNVGGDTSGPFNFDLMFQNRSMKANQRMVDPEVAAHTTAAASLRLSEDSLISFRSLWSAVGELRKSAQSVSNTTMAEHWHKLTTALPDLRLQPLRSSEDCKRPPSAPECVGVTSGGGCVCYTQVAAPQAIMV